MLAMMLFVLVVRGAPAQGPPLTRIEIGNIVGAEYIPASARFFLYAEPGSGTARAELWRDEVVQTARAWLAVGQNYGFSLDFSRRGTKEFKPDDIYDYNEIVRRLSKSNQKDPVLDVLRDRLGRIALPAASSKPSKRDLRRLTEALNHLMADSSLVPMLCNKAPNPVLASLLKDGCHARRARLIIEDFIGRGVRRDIEHKYVIEYKPTWASVYLQRIFSSGRSEALLLSGDARLKALAGDGGQVPSGLPFGVVSEVNLCGDEAMNASQLGNEIPNGERAEHFSLVSDYANSPALPGKVIWFTNQHLVVSTDRAADAQPDCSDRFAAALTKNLPRIINYDGQIGSDLKNLLALLELARAIDYFAPFGGIDKDYLRTIPTERITNVPPPVVDTPIRFARAGKAFGYRSFGGVLLGDSPFSPTPKNWEVTEATSGKDNPEDSRLIEPGFAVKTIAINGTTLLRVDITSILTRTPGFELGDGAR